MADPVDNTQRIADKILSIFKPILTSPTSDSIRTISEALRAIKPQANILAATINVFAKLLSIAPPTEQPTISARQNCFRELVSHLFTTPLLCEKTLYDALDGDTAAILLPDGKWRGDNLRVRTRMWYTQTRFNLFREESEGYAKIILLMWDCTLSASDPAGVFQHLLSLIGQYSLDTNRVIEIVLSAAAEKVLESIAKTGGLPVVHRIPQPFSHILDQFPKDHVFAVIGAMLRAYHDPVSSESEAIADVHSTETDAKASTSLVSLVSVMISEGRMKVSDVLGYLSPTDSGDFAIRFKQYERNAEELADRVNGSIMGSQPAADDLRKPRQKNGGSDRDVFSHYKLMERGPLHSFSSQKIHFIVTLIGLCRSKDAITAIFGLCVNGEHVDVAAHPTIAKPLVGIAEALLNPLLHSRFPFLYAKNTHVLEAIRKLGGREKGYDVPVETMEEFLTEDEEGPGAVVRQILMVLGPNARASIRLLQGVCRVFKGRKDKHVIAIMKEVILPAAAVVQSNAALSHAIWDVLKEWPHPLRWSLYKHLDKAISTSCAAYRIASSRASYETRYILKRLTADNQKHHTMTMAKITHGQALAAFSATLDRIQGYPADSVTISPVVESFRRCTDLSIDILLYLVLNRMANSRRSCLKDDGINTAQWYATLSLFLGLCLRKLTVASEHIDAVLHFVHSKLVEDDEPLFIIALTDIIECVAGINVDINLSPKQIASHGGGPVLREVVSSTWSKLRADSQMCGTMPDLRSERERSSAISALLAAFERTGLHAYIAVAIARLTRDAVYHETIRTMPLKLGANIADMARTSLLQMSQFLDTSFSSSNQDRECRDRIWRPLRDVGMVEMIVHLGVPVSSAIALMVPVIDCIAELEMEHSKQVRDQPSSQQSTTDAAGSSQGGSPPNSQMTVGTKGPESCQSKDDMVQDCSPDIGKKMETQSPNHVADIVHRRVRGTISTSFITIFWFAKLSDLAVPVQVYEEEQKRFASIQTVWEKEIETYRRRSVAETDRFRRIELELCRIREYVKKLEIERSLMTERQSSVLKVLEEQRMKFESETEKVVNSGKLEETYFFLQECILPRCKLSRPDAYFCSKFVQLLLNFDLPGICYTEYYEVFLQLTPVVIRSCSENESLCYSLLVKETLITLERWRSNRGTFEKEASVEKRHGLRDLSSANKADPMKHWQFCQWLFQIHDVLTSGLFAVLSNGEYLCARNSLSLLNAVAEVFPRVSDHCAKVEQAVQTLTKSDLADVRLTATGVLAKLRAGKARRLPKHVFTLKPVGGGSGSQASKITGRNMSNKIVHQPAEKESSLPERSATTVNQRDSGKGSSSSKQASPMPNTSRAGLEGSGEKTTSTPAQDSKISLQKKVDYAHSAPGKTSNVDIARSDQTDPKKQDERKVLNPDAKEFVPSTSRPEMTILAGKRSRTLDTDQSTSALRKDHGTVGGEREATTLGSDMAPPLKKARGEDTRQKERDGKTTSEEGSYQSLGAGVGKIVDKVPSKKDGRKSDRGNLPAPRKETNAKTSGGRGTDKQREHALNVSRKQSGALEMAENHRKNGGFGGKSEGKHIGPSTTNSREGTARRSPSQGRASSPGRNDSTTRQSLQNGKEPSHNKAAPGDRYRDGGGSRGMRRDSIGGTGAQGREVQRENLGRDYGGTRRREGGGYNYGGTADRRGMTPTGDFRRSLSESRLTEGSGGGDYAHGREYVDGHGTKRRRDGGPARNTYSYESDARRPRPRSDNDYDRIRDEGKSASDRRFNGNSPHRDGGGGPHNPNWMENRWHDDAHEGIRRQSDDNHLGWQKRGDRDMESGSRMVRRDAREPYHERQERYGEGPPRRDDRRRINRARPPRRRGGK